MDKSSEQQQSSAVHSLVWSAIWARAEFKLHQKSGSHPARRFGRLTGIREVLQNEFRHDFRKCPREILAGTVITVLKAIMHVNTVNTVPAEISRRPFRKSYRNSFCKTSLLLLIVRRDRRGRRCERTSGDLSEKHETLHWQLEFFLGVFEESKGIDSRQSADLSSKISIKCLDTESLEQPTALNCKYNFGQIDVQWIYGTSFSLRRPEEAPKQENACLYSHPHCHSSFFNLKALCILIVVRQKDRQVHEHPCHSHTQRTTNKKVNREVISRCKTSARCKSQQK